MQDSRQSLSKIAKAVKLPQQTVSYRIKKLEDSKIIKKYTANIDYSKLGYSRHSLYLYTSVWTKTIEDYDDIQTKILSKFKNKIKNYLSFQSVKSYTYLARVLNSKKKAKVDVKENPENHSISDVDWKLISLLKKNSKITALELSEKLKLTPSSVMRKMKSLEKKGIIQRYYPIIDLKKIGYTEYTFISRIDPSYGEELKKFMEYTKKDPSFVISIKAIGYINLYYAFLVKNHNELKEVRSNIEEILGEALLQEYKVEVDDMIS